VFRHKQNTRLRNHRLGVRIPPGVVRASGDESAPHALARSAASPADLVQVPLQQRCDELREELAKATVTEKRVARRRFKRIFVGHCGGIESRICGSGGRAEDARVLFDWVNAGRPGFRRLGGSKFHVLHHGPRGQQRFCKQHEMSGWQATNQPEMVAVARNASARLKNQTGQAKRVAKAFLALWRIGCPAFTFCCS
jgi:hypothetical protein